MIVLGLLQNQWARNPQAVEAMFARHPKRRHELIARLLMQSYSGRRLKEAFGTWVNRMVWEEASPGIVGLSGGCLAPDVEHINRTLREMSPDIVITFGKQAELGLARSSWTGPTVTATHPAARAGDMPQRLRDACRELDLAERELPG